jgi:hypothetical protein
VAVTEVPCESLGLLEIVERIKPIDELSESVLESTAPLRRGLLRPLREDAIRLAVFKLDDTKGAPLLVPENDVRTQVAHERVLEGKMCGGPDVGSKRPEECGKLFALPEEWQDVRTFV